jgi:CheY-like chemotaxis protein
MDKNTLKRVFEPFFTTKEKGMGTGLGLASVYGIIRNHGGFINVYSELGHGAAFNFHLPVSGRSLASEVKNKEEVLTGNENILVVEDEQSVLETTAELLQSLGYRVQIAGGGQEATAIYLEKKDQIDLVMLDMVMPGMSGEKTFEILREICPDVKVILSTGFSETGPAKAIMQKGCNGFIQKPYNIIDLSKKLREVLER